MVYVIKASGEKQEFDKGKIYYTCIRSGVSEKNAKRIADEVEKAVYDGISTREVLKIVLRKLDKLEKTHALSYVLRDNIAEYFDGEEFEKYVQKLLNAKGYETQWNVVKKGELVEHQIDIIAQKDWKKYHVECKHHSNAHRFTGLQEVMQTWAAFDDLNKGGAELDNAWLVTNTKLSEHAIRYGKGKNLIMTSWNYPAGNDLRSWIANSGLYPVTILKLDEKTKKELIKNDIISIRELAGIDIEKMHLNIKERALNELISKAKKILKA